MTHQEIIGKTVEFVKSELKHAEGGHDWWHIERVLNSARTIAQTEPVNPFIVELGALLHDLADHKFNGIGRCSGCRQTGCDGSDWHCKNF